jgi:hypothetical protein
MKLKRFNSVKWPRKINKTVPVTFGEMQNYEDTPQTNNRLIHLSTFSNLANSHEKQTDQEVIADNNIISQSHPKRMVSLKRVSKENDKYSVKYYWTQAGTGLVLNLTHLFFGPLSIFLLRRMFGKNLCHAMVFDFSRFYFLSEFTNWLWVIGTLLFIYFKPELTSEMSIVYLSTGSVIILSQVMVSLKYGYFTKKKWKIMKETWVNMEFIRENLIIPSWVKVPKTIARREIIASLKRFRINPHDIVFKFNKIPEICLEDCEDDQDSIERSDLLNKKVSMVQIAKYLVLKVTETQKTFELKIFNFLALVYVLIVILLRYYAFDVSGFSASVIEIIYIFISSIKSFYGASHFIKFIAAGLYDFKRKKMLMAQCTGLISKVDHKHMVFKGDNKPELDLHDPMTILAWYCLRRTFLDFGKRYTKRVFMYASLVFPVCIAVIVILFLQLGGIVSIKYNLYLIPALFLTIEVFIVIIRMSGNALSLNYTFAVHRDLLLESFMKFKDKPYINSETVRNLAFVIERLRHDEVFRPAEILGIAINESFLINILIVGLSGVFAIVRLGLSHS